MNVKCILQALEAHKTTTTALPRRWLSYVGNFGKTKKVWKFQCVYFRQMVRTEITGFGSDVNGAIGVESSSVTALQPGVTRRRKKTLKSIYKHTVANSRITTDQLQALTHISPRRWAIYILRPEFGKWTGLIHCNATLSALLASARAKSLLVILSTFISLMYLQRKVYISAVQLLKLQSLPSCSIKLISRAEGQFT